MTDDELSPHPDPAIESIMKCKPASHLRVVVRINPDAHGSADQSVRDIETLVCRNTKEGIGEPAWGALIAPAGKVIGMHLYASAVKLIAHQFPLVAAEARATGQPDAAVSLEHPVLTVFRSWRDFEPDTADEIAAACEQILVAHGLS